MIVFFGSLIIISTCMYIHSQAFTIFLFKTRLLKSSTTWHHWCSIQYDLLGRPVALRYFFAPSFCFKSFDIFRSDVRFSVGSIWFHFFWRAHDSSESNTTSESQYWSLSARSALRKIFDFHIPFLQLCAFCSKLTSGQKHSRSGHLAVSSPS